MSAGLPAEVPSSSAEHIEWNETYGAHNYHPLPVVLARGEGCWVWDVEGRRYLDCLAAYSAVNQGHCHPRLVQALTEQASRLTLTSRAFHNDQLGPYLRKLAALCGLEVALPMNTGAEAVETALKMARKWGYEVKGVPEGQAEILVFGGNFHGRTTTIVGFSSSPEAKAGFGPFTPGFVEVPYGDLEALGAAITPNTVAVLVEPIQGEGGVVVPPEGFLKGIRALCDEHRVLFLADEIQTGLGRTGKFFACEHEDVVPDAYILGKALSGGLLPVSAVVANKEVMGVFTPGTHGSTYGGNPLACAVACEALDVLLEERLPARAAEQGQVLMDGIRALNSPHVELVRGKGLMVGVVFKQSAGPAKPFCKRLMKAGILCKDTHEQVMRLAPPLVIDDEQIQLLLAALRGVLLED